MNEQPETVWDGYLTRFATFLGITRPPPQPHVLGQHIRDELAKSPPCPEFVAALTETKERIQADILDQKHGKQTPPLPHAEDWVDFMAFFNLMQGKTVSLTTDELVAAMWAVWCKDCERRSQANRSQDWCSVLISLFRHWLAYGYEKTRRNQRKHPLLPFTLLQSECPSDIKRGAYPPAHFASSVQLGTEMPSPLAVLPGFGQERELRQSWPLELWDSLAAARESTTRRAPFALCLFLEGILGVNMADWGELKTVTMPLRELLSYLFPNPARQPRPAEYLPGLTEAAEVLDRAWIPVMRTDGVYAQRVVQVGHIPLGRGALNREVTLRVDLPPSPVEKVQGASVNRRLLRQLAASRTQHRCYINLSYLLHDPGTTLKPTRKGWSGVRWSRKVEDYPLLTRGGIVNLCHPRHGNAPNHRYRLVRSRETLQQLEARGVIHLHAEGRHNLRILPGRLHAGYAVQFND